MGGQWYLIVSIYLLKLERYTAKYLLLEAKEEAEAEIEARALWSQIISEKKYVVVHNGGTEYPPKLPQLIKVRGL